MLQIVRDLKHYKDTNATAFVSGLKRVARDEGVKVKEIIIGEQNEINIIDFDVPTIVIKPFEFNVENICINDVDINATANVITDICLNHVPCNVLIVNRSSLIGKPVQENLVNRDYTTIMAHSKTNGLQRLIDASEIIVFATGSNMKKYNCEGKYVIDVSGDYHREKCGTYFPMKSIGKKTIEKIIKNAKENDNE